MARWRHAGRPAWKMAFFTFVLCAAATAHDGPHGHERKARASARGARLEHEESTTEHASPRRTRFALGVYVTQDFLFTGGSSSSTTPAPGTAAPQPANDGHNHTHARGALDVDTVPVSHAGEDHSAPPPSDPGGLGGGGSTTFSPVVTVKGGYRMLDDVALVLSVPAQVNTGLRDPSVGAFYHSVFTHELGAMFGLQAFAPLSTASQNANKMTALAASATTLYESGRFFGGVGGSLGPTFYNGAPRTPAAATTTPAAASTRELFTTNLNAYAGIAFARRWSVSAAGNLTGFYREDRNFAWMTDLTLARLAYTQGGFLGALGYTLVSGTPTAGSLPAPSQSMVGFRLQYVFGSQTTLGVLAGF